MKFNLFFKYIALTVLIICSMAGSLQAQTLCPLDSLTPRKVTNLSVFKRIPILSDGRIKPLETYAENFLLQLSARRSYKEEDAVTWFARYIFAPRTTFEDKIFLINNPEIAETLKIEPEEKRRYSYRQLESHYEQIRSMAVMAQNIDAKERSVVEEELVRLHRNLRKFVKVSGAFMYAFVHPDFDIPSNKIKKMLDLPVEQPQFSFYDLFTRSEKLRTIADQLALKDPSEWNEEEDILGRLINALYFWTDYYANSSFDIIPTLALDDERWLSPMDIIKTAYFHPEHQKEITMIRDMMISYWNNDPLTFNLSAKTLISSIEQRASAKEKKAISTIPVELNYNTLDPFLWCKLLYGIAFLVFLISLFKDTRIAYRITYALTILSIVLHTTGIIMRISILDRPPVSNLYETFIFVGIISALLGLIIEKVNRNWIGLAVSNISGLVFLFIANKFAADGDTLQVLVAVLNSNFWLSTHVTSITIGYAGSSVAGIIGHIWLLQAIAKPNDKKRLAQTMNNMLGVLGFGLTMTFLGTALGGIWADQSWGRFWGWDPKENGALLIVLWSALIFHARIAKMMSGLGTALSCVFGLIVVMWAWFGVNLLSVGLHSYGFTSGIATTLMIYFIIEMLFIGVCFYILKRKGFKL